jgi:CRP/FNR family transcriptional regulator, cyclic AMP receptor protein
LPDSAQPDKQDSRQVAEGLRLAGRFRQVDLADLLGTTTRSIITVLNGWRTAGLVTYDAERAMLTICRKESLEALVS